jgi:uncharacterized protein (DUF1778 family)
MCKTGRERLEKISDAPVTHEERRIRLKADVWAEFHAGLDAPPKETPRLARLFEEQELPR